MSVADAVFRLNKAIAALESAKEKCPYDQGYFLAREMEDVEMAERFFVSELKNALGIFGSDNP